LARAQARLALVCGCCISFGSFNWNCERTSPPAPNIQATRKARSVSARIENN
jgi:hypothetical protein